MSTQTFALVVGIAFAIVGVVGFIPALTPPHVHPNVTVAAGSGLALGLFPVNAIHNLVHLAFGAWGVLAANGFDTSRAYARVVAVAYGLLTVLGLVPATNSAFGFVPIYGHDIWLHAVVALAAAYFGFVRTSRPLIR